jgi:hypothetical protein
MRDYTVRVAAWSTFLSNQNKYTYDAQYERKPAQRMCGRDFRYGLLQHLAFEFDIDTGRKRQIRERFKNLRRRRVNIDEALVNAHLKLFA